MTMWNCLDPIIRARLCKSSRLIALALLVAGIAAAQSLDALAANYRKTPNVRTRAALLRFAKAHPSDQAGALALLALGSTEIEQRQFGDALHHLQAAQKRLPKLADYAGYMSAVSQSELREFSGTEASLAPVWQSTPASPWVAKSVGLQVNAFIEQGQPAKAVALVEQRRLDLAEPQAEWLLARTYAAEGNGTAAAAQYQKVYVEHPLSPEAAVAEAELAHDPPIPPQARLARCLKLIEGGDYSRSRKELSTLLPELTGADLDLARVRIGAALYFEREFKAADEHLRGFQAATPEAEAERLYYLAESARRLDRIDDMRADLEKLSAEYPQSAWRLKSMISAANYFAAHHQQDAADALYQACYGAFPNDPRSAPCHWKIAWSAYLRDPAGAAGLFRDHLTLYPDSDRTSTALYFLGRIAESKPDPGAARVYYEYLNRSLPNYYYAMLARERLSAGPVAAATASPEARQFLSGIHFTSRKPESFVASATTRQRIERAHLLAGAGMDDLAEAELRFGAQTDGQPQLMALELADLASRRDAPDQAIRYIKHYAPAYLALSVDSVPDKFWRLAFPMPYRKSLEEYCRERSLDPYLVAALIRQESEFNPKAVSRSNARGLTQVLPGTGRELSRKLKIRPYRTSMLFKPDTNLKIGTYYLKALFDQLQGKWEETLASYNAGKSRVVSWVSSANFHEPAEFVESIPFNETRVYVQNVMRNAEMYRRLYGASTR